MARRSDPGRIFQARRHALRNRLANSGIGEERAEAWMVAWESSGGHALDRFTAVYWEACDAWIAAQRAARRQPSAKAPA